MTFDPSIRGQVGLAETAPSKKIKFKMGITKFLVDLEKAQLLGILPTNQIQRCWWFGIG